MKVIVTGSEGLIGSETCTHLETLGHEVTRLDLALGHDLTDEDFTREFFSSNPADALVNLFALNQHITASEVGQGFLDVSVDSFRQYMEINVVTLFSVCREFIRANDEGVILNASSIYGVRAPRPSLYSGAEKHMAYGSSKAAVISLTSQLSVCAAPNFRANCIIIGGVASEQPPDFVERYSNHVPIGRMAKQSEIPPMIEFLISSSSTYVTGAALAIDGGWTA